MTNIPAEQLPAAVDALLVENRALKTFSDRYWALQPVPCHALEIMLDSIDVEACGPDALEEIEEAKAWILALIWPTGDE